MRPHPNKPLPSVRVLTASRLVAAPSQLAFDEGRNRDVFGVVALWRMLVNDAEAKVSRFQGALSAEELRAAVRKAQE